MLNKHHTANSVPADGDIDEYGRSGDGPGGVAQRFRARAAKQTFLNKYQDRDEL